MRVGCFEQVHVLVGATGEIHKLEEVEVRAASFWE